MANFVACVCVTVAIAGLAVFALNAMLYAVSEHSLSTAFHEFLWNPNPTSNSFCNCTGIPQPAALETPTNPPGQKCPKTENPQPWYLRDRAGHYPVKFPRCTMDACFDFSRCKNMSSDLRIYVYDFPPPSRYFEGFKRTPWYTPDPEKACLFFLFTETADPYHDPAPPRPETRRTWNNGLNHVLVSFADSWHLSHIDDAAIGNASLLRTGLYQSIYRPGFDISITVPPKMRFHQFQSLKPWQRRYFLTFRGLRYLGGPNTGGGVRSDDALREMHNGDDIIVALTCQHPSNIQARQENATIAQKCDHDEQIFSQFSDYRGLMNSTFGLTPAGRQPNTYRCLEFLSAGTIPVLISDNYVKPFDTLIQWHRCILEFATTEIKLVIPTLREMKKDEMEKRQLYCLKIYSTYFSSDEALLNGAIDSLKARFMGSLPGLLPENALKK